MGITRSKVILYTFYPLEKLTRIKIISKGHLTIYQTGHLAIHRIHRVWFHCGLCGLFLTRQHALTHTHTHLLTHTHTPQSKYAKMLSDLFLHAKWPPSRYPPPCNDTLCHALTRIDTHEEEAVAIFEPQSTATDAETRASALWPGPFCWGTQSLPASPWQMELRNLIAGDTEHSLNPMVKSTTEVWGFGNGDVFLMKLWHV